MARVRRTVNRIAIALTCGHAEHPDGEHPRRRRHRGDLPALRHGCRDVVRGRPARRRRHGRPHRGGARANAVARVHGRGRRGDRLRVRVAAPRARGVPVVGRRRGVHPRRPPPPRHRPRALREAVRAVAAAGLLRRARRHHAAERGQRRPARVARVRPGRRLSGGGLEVRRVARRRVVAAPLQDLVATPAPPLSVAEAQALPAWSALLPPTP